MFNITLPDGSLRQFEQPISVADLAQSIGAGLAKAALAGTVNGMLVDTSFVLDQDAQVSIVTGRDSAGLDILRHSCAHLMAMAVQELFPGTQVTIGPVIEHGFYYDFDCSTSFTEDDLAKIEARMYELAKADQPVSRELMSRAAAIELFERMGEHYKVEIIRDIPSAEALSFYRQGNFIDLCRGPHIPSTGKLQAFKLMKVAGAYWRGDSKNKMLQRIYGTCWANKQDLKDYLHRLEEAEKRDHRKIGKRLGLFHTQEEAPGMVFWHPNGWTVYQVLEQYMRQVQRTHGYLEIKTPQVVDRALWERSGHWSNYGELMFTTESEKRDYAVKPMNCPCHVQVFNQGLKSYRDLPIRLAEFGACHRNEPSGSLHGILRVRGFTQDDAHIFCTQAQMQSEAADFIAMTRAVYADFGFTDIALKLSTRPAKRVGSDLLWDRAEQALEAALHSAGLAFELQPGEGAFYGPKIEFSLKDCLGRVWQCGTLQLDFNLPERLGAEYVSEDNSRQHPVMLHRAVLGSFERFIGVLIEHYEGAFPAWLAPVQAVVMNITDQQAAWAEEIVYTLNQEGFRTQSDLRNEKIGYKIRAHTLLKVPYLLVVGDREVASKQISVRTRDGRDLGSMSPADFKTQLMQAIAQKGRPN